MVIHDSESTKWVEIQTNNTICWFCSSLIQCKPIQEVVLCTGVTFHWMSFGKPKGTLVENNDALTWQHFRHNEWAKAKAGHCLNATISTGLHLNRHWSTAVALVLSKYFMLIFNYAGTVCYSQKPTDNTTLELCDKAEQSFTTNTWYFIHLKNSFVSF